MRIHLLYILVLLGLTSHCFNPFAPKLDNTGNQSIVITEQRSPDEVLQNFLYAYTFKDSLVYADLLDSSFVFVYFDPNIGSSGRFVSWGRDVDLKTTGQLFRNAETINLTWNSTIYQDTTYIDTTSRPLNCQKPCSSICLENLANIAFPAVPFLIFVSVKMINGASRAGKMSPVCNRIIFATLASK